MDALLPVCPQRARKRGWRGAPGFLAAGLLAVVLLPTVAGRTAAWAADGPTPIAERVAEWTDLVETHRKDRDESALKGDLKQAVALYGEAGGEDKVRATIVKLVGLLTKSRRDEVIVTAALLTLANMGDDGGARYVRPYLKQRDRKEAPPLLKTAVKVAGAIPTASLVGPLLTLVEKSDHTGIAAEAMRALGKFGGVKRKRVEILERLLKTTKRSKPGGPPRMAGGGGGSIDDGSGSGSSPGLTGRDGGATGRWNTLARALPGALNALTGQDVHSTEDWFLYAKEHKSNLGGLFLEED